MNSHDSFIATNTSLAPETKALWFLLRALPSSRIPKRPVLCQLLGFGERKAARAIRQLTNLDFIATITHNNPQNGRITKSLFFLNPSPNPAFRSLRSTNHQK